MEAAKLATEELSYKSNNLIVAEGTISFLLEELLSQGTPLAKKFYNSIRERINSRRNGTLINLLLYLKNPNYLVSDKHFNVPNKNEIQKLGINILKKHFSKNPNNNSNDTSPSTSSYESSHLQQTSIRDRLKASLSQYASSDSNEQTEPENFKREFAWFERNKVRSPILNQLYGALLTIQPTSTQSERNFSVSNNILTKQRKRLLNKNLNAIVFVKSYFDNLN